MNKNLNEWIKSNRSKLIATRTRAERYLFSKLPRKIRQSAKIHHPIIVNDHVYFIDIYLSKIQVAIEVDGWSHAAKQEKDDLRDKELLSLNIKTLRISNTEVFCEDIRNMLIDAVKDYPVIKKLTKKEKKSASQNKERNLKIFIRNLKINSV